MNTDVEKLSVPVESNARCAVGTPSRTVMAFIVALIALFPVAFMWQGLDVTDSGYYMVNCQQFFNGYPHDFGDAQYTAYWLTNFVGACWYKLTGECGLIGFRAFYVLLTYGTLFLCWLAFKSLSPVKVLLALLAAEVAVVGLDIYVPSYNQVSSFLFVASAVALYHGLVSRRRALVFIAGTLAGISIFARIVNAPIGMLVCGVWFYHLLRPATDRPTWLGSLRSSLRETTLFLVGMASGLALVACVIVSLGHLSAFRDMWTGLTGMASGPKTGYGPIVLLKKFVWDYLFVGASALVFVVLALIGGRLSFGAARPAPRWTAILIFAGAAIIALLRFPLLNIWAIPAVLNVIMLAAALGLLGCSLELRLICFLAAIVLFVTPLGSADGMCNSFHGLFLAVPAALLALLAPRSNPTVAEDAGPSGLSRIIPRLEPAQRWLAKKLDLRPVGWACLISIIGFAAIYRCHFSYRDASDRAALVAPVNHPKLRGILTTPERAGALDELLSQLAPLVKEDDYLFEHMQLPLIYFLTQTRPYLFTAWPNLYQPPAFDRALQKAVSRKAPLPVCVLTKIDTCHPNWPRETTPEIQTYRFAGNRQLVRSFLDSRHYQKRWENVAFEIWVAATPSQAALRHIRSTTTSRSIYPDRRSFHDVGHAIYSRESIG